MGNTGREKAAVAMSVSTVRLCLHQIVRQSVRE
jgi:hypothetical protein